jgi:hypothetical protein
MRIVQTPSQVAGLIRVLQPLSHSHCHNVGTLLAKAVGTSA